MKRNLSILALALALGSAAFAQQGVSKDTLTLGSIQDLSGPLAGFGKQVRMGLLLAADEINEQGGVNGRNMWTLRSRRSNAAPAITSQTPQRMALTSSGLPKPSKRFS